MADEHVFANDDTILHCTDNIVTKQWSAADIVNFINDWKDDVLTMESLSKKYHRSVKSLLAQAFRLNLKPRVFYTRYLTVSDVAREMCVSKATVYRWFRQGLKSRRCSVDKQKRLILPEDLLLFLEKNQSSFNASIVSEYLFIDEPLWFTQKRKSDKDSVWSKSDDDLLIHFVERGFNGHEIACKMNRSYDSIRNRLSRMNLKPCRKNGFSDKDISFLKVNSDYYTLSELSRMMNGRSENSIKCKCRDLRLPYHISKARCASVDA